MTDKTDGRDPPIEPQNYLSGVTVIDLGDYRVSRGKTRREHSACPHRQMVYDPAERRIWCQDCERDIDAFDALVGMVESYDRAHKDVTERAKRLAEAETFRVRMIAAKVLDEAWRSHKMVPACPHCGEGLFPEHFKNGVSRLGRDYAEARLKRKAKADDR